MKIQRLINSKIKAIIFDVGGVLQVYKFSLLTMKKHTHLSIHDFMARKLGINLDQWFDAIDTAYADSITGKIPKERELNIISKNLKITPEHLEHLWIRAYKKYFKRNNRLFQVAEDLKKQGYKIMILSDQHHISKEALVPKEDYRLFDNVFVSSDLGMRKPNPKFYKFALKKTHLKPHETIFIDNQIWNIKPAKKLGIKTILFKNNRQVIKDLKKLGVKI
jgi:epoxide hydrolase-like predicted phosphatase